MKKTTWGGTGEAEVSSWGLGLRKPPWSHFERALKPRPSGSGSWDLWAFQQKRTYCHGGETCAELATTSVGGMSALSTFSKVQSLLGSSPLSTHPVTAALCCRVSRSPGLLPCGATEAFTPSRLLVQPGQRQGWETSAWGHTGWNGEKGGESQARAKRELTGWGDWALGGIGLSHSMGEGWRLQLHPPKKSI